MIPTLILSITLIVMVAASDSKSQMDPVISQKPSLMCFNEIYKIPIMSMHSLRTTFNRTLLIQGNISSINVLAMIVDREVLQFQNNADVIMTKVDLIDNHPQNNTDQSMIDVNLNLKAQCLDRTFIHYFIKMIYLNDQTDYINCSVAVLTLPPKRLSNRIYIVSIPFIIIFISLQMGILLNLEALKVIIRRPIAVAISFFCQYGFMPIIAFAISKIFRYPALYGFGLFVVGCCPAAPTSIQLTAVFDGDLNLSVLIFFASTVASFFMMPLWLYTLGTYAYLRQLKIYIPFWNLMLSLVTVLGALSVGMIIAYYIPQVKSPVKRIVKPVFILIFIYVFGFGTYANFFLFTCIDWRMAVTTSLLPWLGYIIGGAVAWIFRQDWIRVTTIGIGTGIQNVGVALMVLFYSLSEPENYQAVTITMIIVYLSWQPFYAILLINRIRQKCFKKKVVKIEKTAEIGANSEDATANVSQHLTDSDEQHNDDSNKLQMPPISVMGNACEL